MTNADIPDVVYPWYVWVAVFGYFIVPAVAHLIRAARPRRRRR